MLTCMDARVDPARVLALGPEDAHVLRNAGGVATADVIESLAASQTGFGTRSIAVVHHTDCAGLALRMPHFPPEGSVRATVRLLRTAPALPHRDAIRGYVLDVGTGVLTEVETGSTQARGGARTGGAGRRPPVAVARPRPVPLVQARLRPEGLVQTTQPGGLLQRPVPARRARAGRRLREAAPACLTMSSNTASRVRPPGSR